MKRVVKPYSVKGILATSLKKKEKEKEEAEKYPKHKVTFSTHICSVCNGDVIKLTTTNLRLTDPNLIGCNTTYPHDESTPWHCESCKLVYHL